MSHSEHATGTGKPPTSYNLQQTETHHDVIDDEKVLAHHVAHVDPDLARTETEGEFRWTINKAIAMIAIMLPFAMDVVYLSGASSLLSVINADVGPSSSYSWIVGSFATAASAVSPLAGRLSDIFGRRYFIFGGTVLSAIGALICAVAPTINALIGGGVIAGLGFACHQIAYPSIGELVPKRSRGLAIGSAEGFLGLVSAFTPVIAYQLHIHASWRDLFWLIFAVNMFSLGLIFFWYHPMNQYIKEEGKTSLQQFLAVDWIGTALFTAGLTLFLLGLSFGGSTFPWKSAGAIVPIVLGVVLLIVCGLWEAYAELQYPIFPPVIFRNIGGFTMIILATLVVGLLYYACLIIYPQQASNLYTTSPSKIGWYASAYGFGGASAPALCGYLVKKTGGLQWWFRGIVVAIMLISGCQAIVTPTSEVGSTILVTICGGLVASATAVGIMIVQLSLPHEYIGVATQTVSTARSTGGAIATTIYVTILVGQIPGNIVKDLATPLAEAGVAPTSIPAIIGALTEGVDTSVLATLTPTQLGIAGEGLKWAFAHSYRTVYLVSIAFGALGVLCTILINNVDDLMTSKVDIKLEEGMHLHSHADTGEGHIIKHAGPHE